MSLKDKIIIWIYKKGETIDNELEKVNLQAKYMPLDSLDHFELMNAKIRLNAWKEFLNELFKIVFYCK